MQGRGAGFPWQPGAAGGGIYLRGRNGSQRVSAHGSGLFRHGGRAGRGPCACCHCVLAGPVIMAVLRRVKSCSCKKASERAGRILRPARFFVYRVFFPCLFPCFRANTNKNGTLAHTVAGGRLPGRGRKGGNHFGKIYQMELLYHVRMRGDRIYLRIVHRHASARHLSCDGGRGHCLAGMPFVRAAAAASTGEVAGLSGGSSYNATLPSRESCR